jgi:hypothetical protein
MNTDEGGNNDVEENAYYYQLKLSLKTVVENKTDDNEENDVTGEEGMTTKDNESVAVPLAAGSLLMFKRMKVLQLVNCLRRDDGLFLPGYAVVSIKSKFLSGPLSNSSGGAVKCTLPYAQLMDSYGTDLSNPPVELDGITQGKLTVGKRIDAEGMVLSVPNGADALPVVSLRPSLIDAIKKNQSAKSSSSNGNDDLPIFCPSPKSNIFMDITELADVDGWDNMPLGNARKKATLWLLSSWHVMKQGQEGGEVSDFITFHIHRINNKHRCHRAAVQQLLWWSSCHCCRVAIVVMEPPLLPLLMLHHLWATAVMDSPPPLLIHCHLGLATTTT